MESFAGRSRPSSGDKAVSNVAQCMRCAAWVDIEKPHECFEPDPRDAEIARLRAALIDMVSQHCEVDSDNNGPIYLDSWALSANAEAIELLADCGVVSIERSAGRRVIVVWKREALEGGK